MSDRSWTAHLRKEGDTWKVVDKVDEGTLLKRHGLQGPIDDAFMDSFLIVRPTGTPLNEKVGAWTKGDTRAFSSMLAGFEAKSPVAYRMLIADRNARWGQWISDRLQQPGVVFVAVGSGHLAGKDSVQQWLAARGITATRVS